MKYSTIKIDIGGEQITFYCEIKNSPGCITTSAIIEYADKKATYKQWNRKTLGNTSIDFDELPSVDPRLEIIANKFRGFSLPRFKARFDTLCMK